MYEVDQSTGKILWEISPEHSTLKKRKGVEFHFQHDARLGGKHLEMLSLFDDEAGPPIYGPAKGMLLRLSRKSVKFVHAYENPQQDGHARGGGHAGASPR